MIFFFLPKLIVLLQKAFITHRSRLEFVYNECTFLSCWLQSTVIKNISDLICLKKESHIQLGWHEGE